MVDFDLESVLFTELGYDNNPEIKRIDPQYSNRPIQFIDKVYSVQDIQVAYFSRFEVVEPETLWELHRAIWNESKTPLLFVILPQEIRIYNTYELPAETAEELDSDSRLLRHLQNLTDVETARQQIQEQLYQNHYDRAYIETGAFWDSEDGRRINKDNRADHRLLHELNSLRRKLSDAGLSNNMDYAYALIGRSILIRYLEDRDILNRMSPTLEPTQYREILRDKHSVYQFFEWLSQRFQGDLFPILPDEEQIIRQDHLNLIAAFLDGTILDTGQLAFWPYNFEYIPIELISGIYDTFLNTSERQSAGTYYTPHSLADFVLEETMPLEVVKSDMKVLDPACGSGVFLVRAYQRLISAWIREHDGDRPTFQLLNELLKDNIFGIDINQTAIRIATFSLYLTVLDNLDKDSFSVGDFRFPELAETNLITGDFFEESVQKQLEQYRFSRVVGNPPFKSSLTRNAKEWLEKHNYDVGDYQIAQAFLLAAPKLCAEDGEIALLAPARGTISVASRTHDIFRQTFFKHHQIRALFNLSALRYELFPDSKNPTISMFYAPNKPDLDKKFVYVTPKPTSLFQQMRSIMIEAIDVKYITQKRALEFPHIWKIALWGISRDEALIERLNHFDSLSDQINKLNYHMAEGIQIGGQDNNKGEWLTDMSLVPTRSVGKYTLNPDTFTIITETHFHRPKEERIVQAPLALIRESPIGGRCVAAYYNKNVAYKHDIVGISGEDSNILKWIVLYVNSPLASYYHFMTSTRWAVERDNIIKAEYDRMPFVVPDKHDPRLQRALTLFDEIESILTNDTGLTKAQTDQAIKDIETELAEIVFDVFGLSLAERQLVYDTIKYGIGFFDWGKKKTRKPRGAAPVQEPSLEMLYDYAHTFAESANTLLRYQNDGLRAKIYRNGTPLTIVGFERVGQGVQPNETDIESVQSSDEIRRVLDRLNRELVEKKAPSLYMRRQVRIYDGDWMYLIRPSEQRFWSKSQALVDADDAIAEWLTQSTPSQLLEGEVHG